MQTRGPGSPSETGPERGRPEWVEVGHISRVHGVHGELRVLPESDNPDRFMPGSVVYGRPQEVGGAVRRERERVRLTISTVRGDTAFPIVSFQEVPDREGAETLRGLVLEIPAEELPELEDDEFYPFDLLGLEVRDDRGVVWGTVADAFDTPGHALIAVLPLKRGISGRTGDDAEHRQAGEVLIPFVKEAVPEVCMREGYLVVTTRFLDQS